MQLAHYEAAKAFASWHLWLGLPAVVISTLVGTTVFASMEKGAELEWKVTAGLLSVMAAVLTALQTFLKYSELSTKHQSAGAKFANLKHQIELMIAIPPNSQSELKEQLSVLESQWAKVRGECPTVPARIWTKIERSVTFEQHSEKYPITH